MEIEHWVDEYDNYKLTIGNIRCGATVKGSKVYLDIFPRDTFHPMPCQTMGQTKELCERYRAMANFLDAVITGR